MQWHCLESIREISVLVRVGIRAATPAFSWEGSRPHCFLYSLKKTYHTNPAPLNSTQHLYWFLQVRVVHVFFQNTLMLLVLLDLDHRADSMYLY